MSLKSGMLTDVVSPRIEGAGAQMINFSPYRNRAEVFTQPRPIADIADRVARPALWDLPLGHSGARTTDAVEHRKVGRSEGAARTQRDLFHSRLTAIRWRRSRLGPFQARNRCEPSWFARGCTVIWRESARLDLRPLPREWYVDQRRGRLRLRLRWPWLNTGPRCPGALRPAT
jgi:hypothetical protein